MARNLKSSMPTNATGMAAFQHCTAAVTPLFRMSATFCSCQESIVITNVLNLLSASLRMHVIVNEAGPVR